MTPTRLGTTLVELIVTLAIMAIVTGVAALAVRDRRPETRELDPEAMIARARTDAVALRHAVTIDVILSGKPYAVTALPDGGVIADGRVQRHRLNGERVDAP
jgi:hypothetical protein